MAGNCSDGGAAEGSAPDQPAGESSAMQGMKKGPWTAAEDAVLMEYVRTHGEGNWNSVQKNTGLMRCGKSCRLRWANHLRPDLKKGAFSAEEERIVVELHAKYGNKWARMATQLPGRTDNEIKNYWNTRMKRRQRSNLPLYLDGVRKSPGLQQRRHQQLHPQQPHPQRGGYGFDPSPYPFYPAGNFLIPSIHTLHNQPFIAHSEPNHHQFLLNNFNGSFTFPIPSAPSFLYQSIPASSLQNPNPNPNPIPMNLPGIFDRHLTGLGTMMVGAPVEDSAGNESSTNNELLSSQHQSVVPALKPSSSTQNSSDCLIGTPSSYSHKEDYDMEQQLKDQNSGLLDSLLQEAKNIGSKKENFDDEDDSSAGRCHGKRTVEENQNQSFIGPKAMEEARLDDYIFSVDDDLSSLLINFPSAMPRPDWYRGGRDDVLTQESSSSALEDRATGSGLNICSDGNAASPSAAATASEFDWSTRAASCWKNMPGIH